METAFIYTDELWARGFGESHPLKPERLKRTYELLMAYRAFAAPNSRLVAPVPVSREELLLFHTAEYVDAVARLSDVLSLSKGDGLSLSKGDVLSLSKGDVLSLSKGDGRRLSR